MAAAGNVLCINDEVGKILVEGQRKEKDADESSKKQQQNEIYCGPCAQIIDYSLRSNQASWPLRDSMVSGEISIPSEKVF